MWQYEHEEDFGEGSECMLAQDSGSPLWLAVTCIKEPGDQTAQEKIKVRDPNI